MNTETTELVETLYKSTMMSQTEATLRVSGTVTKAHSPLLDSLNDPDFQGMLAMATLISVSQKSPPFLSAVAAGIVYGYDSKQMPKASTMLLHGAVEPVQIDGTDKTVQLTELAEIADTLIKLSSKDNENTHENGIKFSEDMTDRAKLSYCLVFGAEYAKYHRGLANLDSANFNAPKAPPFRRNTTAEAENIAWAAALQVAMARVTQTLKDESKALQHQRIGDNMEDIFVESLGAFSEAVHEMAHEMGGEHADCESMAHKVLMMRSIFMFGRAVEEMAVSRLHNLGELEP